MMRRYNIIVSAFALLASALLATCTSAPESTKTSRVDRLPYYNEPTFTPLWLENSSPELANFHSIPDFELTNQNGDAVTRSTFENKIYVADFFFTSCAGICPKMTSNMALLQDAFAEDESVLLLSHSVMPSADSVATLRIYADANNVTDNKWHMVTGTRNHIYDLGRNHYFIEEDLGVERTEDEFLHTENFVLIDKLQRIRGIYNGLNKGDIQQLIADIGTLQKEG